MLASPTKDVDSALAALESAVLEYKLDGARVQIHKGDDGVRVFSRTGRDVTASVPEIDERDRRAAGAAPRFSTARCSR